MPLNETEGKILLGLLKHGPVPIMGLVEKAGVGGSTVQNGVRSLIAKGLVTDERQERPPFRRTVSLTIFGKKVAEHLEEAEKQISEAQKHVHAK